MQLACFAEEELAGRRQLDALARAVEQLDTEFALSRLMDWLSGGWAMPSISAARPRWISSATTRK